MAVAYNSGSSELWFTGAVTNAQIETAISNGVTGITRSSENVYILGANLRLRDACDLRGLENCIIDLKTHEIFINNGSATGDTAPVDVTWRNVLFIESGQRAVGDRHVFGNVDHGTASQRGDIKYRAIGGGFIHNIDGRPASGDRRYLTQIAAEEIQNVRIFATDRSLESVDGVEILTREVVSNIELRKVNGIIIGQRANAYDRAWMRNTVHTSFACRFGGRIGLFNSSSLIMEGYDNSPYDPDNTGSDNRWLNTWQAGSGERGGPTVRQDHWLYMLGSAAEYAASKLFTSGGQNTGISQRVDELHIVGGGMRYYNVQGGNGATVRYYDSRSATTAQKHRPTTSGPADMLLTDLTQTIGSDENATILTHAWVVNANTTPTAWTRTAITNQRIIISLYGKTTLDIDVSADPDAAVGSADSPAPILMLDDPLITESDKSVVDAYSTLNTPAQVYDRIAAEKADNPAFGGLGGTVVRLDGDTLDAGSRNVKLNTMAPQVIAVSDTTLTIKAGSTFTGGIRTTGTVTTSGVTVSGSVLDSTGVTILVTGLPTGHDAVVGAWPVADGADSRTNNVTAEIGIIRRMDISMTAGTGTVSTVGGSFSKFLIGTTVEIFGFSQAANNGDFTVESIAGDNLSMVLSRASGSFVDEAAGDDVVIIDKTTNSLSIKLAADTDYFLVADAVSYLRSTPVRFNTGAVQTVEVGLREIRDAAGNDLVPLHSDLTADEKAQCDQIDYDVAADTIAFGATAEIQKYAFKTVARAIEVGQSSAAALSNPYICLIQSGAFILESGSSRMIQRKAGLDGALVPDLSAFQFAKTGSTDLRDFVDFANGAIIVDDGPPAVVSVSGTSEADFHRYLSNLPAATRQAIADALTQSRFDTLIGAVPSSTKDTYKGTGGGSGSGSTLTQSAFDSLMAGLPDSTKNALKADVSTLATMAQITGLNDVSTGAIIAAIQSMDASNENGTQTLATVLDAIKAVVDAIPTDNSIGQSAFDTLMAGVPSGTKESYHASTTSITSQITAIQNALGAGLFGADFVGTWQQGNYAVDNVVISSVNGIVRYWRCTMARTAANTDAPQNDTDAWDMLGGSHIADRLSGLLDGYSIDTDINLREGIRILLGVAGGRVEANATDDTKLDIRSFDDTLVATIPKFVGDSRPSGATTP